MTVENQNSKSGPYALDGGTLRFPRQFFIKEAAHLRVIQVIDGVEVELTTGFTQTGIDDDEGEVVFTEATYPVGGGDLVLKRDIPITQETDYSNQARVRPEQVEDDLDNVVRMIQDIKEVVDRSLHLSVNMDPTDADLDALTRASMAISGAIDEIETVAGNIDAVKTTAEDIEYIQKVSTGIEAIKEFSGSVLSFHDKSFEAVTGQYNFDVGAYIYSPENAFVWMNKVRLVPHEQYSTEGTVVQLTSPAAGGDVVDVLVVSAVSSDDVFRARDEAVEAAQALKDVTTVQHKAFLSVAGQKRYTLDASGRPLNVLRDAHTLSGAAPFGDLHYGADYTVSDGGIDFIEDVPAGHLFLVKTYPATTNAEALALKTEIMEAVDLISEAPHSWADFARFLGYADGKVVWFAGGQYVRDRAADMSGLETGPGWRPLGEVVGLPSVVTTRDTTLMVGPGGDYTTLNQAINAASKIVRSSSGSRFDIRLLSGFAMSEQVRIDRIDLSWLRIISDDAVVPIVRSALTTEMYGDYPAFCAAFYAGFPNVSCLFEMDDSGDAVRRSGFIIADGARALIDAGAGVRYSPNRGLHVANGASVVARNAIFSGSGFAPSYAGGGAAIRNGNGFVEARGADLTNSAIGLKLAAGSVTDAESADVSGATIRGIEGISSTVLRFANGVADGCATAAFLEEGATMDCKAASFKNATVRGIEARSGAKVSGQGVDVSGAATYAVYISDAEVRIPSSDISGAGQDAVHAYGGYSNISLCDLKGAGGAGLRAHTGHQSNAQQADATGVGNGSSTYGFMWLDGCQINANAAIGTFQRTLNSISRHGICYGPAA